MKLTRLIVAGAISAAVVHHFAEARYLRLTRQGAMKEACERYDSRACLKLLWRLDGTDVDSEWKFGKAARLMEQRCGEGDAESCSSFGKIELDQGRKERAEQYFIRSLELGDPMGTLGLDLLASN